MYAALSFEGRLSLKMVSSAKEVGYSIFKVAETSALVAGLWPRKRHLIYRIYSTVIRLNAYLLTVQCWLLLGKYLFLDQDLPRAFEHLSYAVSNGLFLTKIVFCKKPATIGMIEAIIKNANDNAKEYLLAGKWDIAYYRFLNVIVIVSTIISASVFATMNLRILSGTAPEDYQHLQWYCWYPFDLEIYGRILFWSETLRILPMTQINISTQITFNTIIIDCVARLKVLQYKFSNFHVNDNGLLNDRDAYYRLRTLAIDHQNIIRYVTDLNKSIQYLLLTEYNISSVMIGSILIQIIQGNNLPFHVCFLLLLTSQLMLLCWNINEIPIQSVKLSDAIYRGGWYLYGKPVGQVAQIMLARSLRPLFLTIGPFGPLTARSGVEALKLAYSCISVMSGSKL